MQMRREGGGGVGNFARTVFCHANMLGQQCCDMCLKSFNQSTWFGCFEDCILRNYAFSGAFSLVMGSLPPLSFILSRKIQSRTNQNTEAFREFRRQVLLG